MSELVFPQSPGMAWGLQKSPMWSGRSQKSVSGKRQAMGYMSYPLYKYVLSFSVLREYDSYTELETLQGFFNQLKGNVDTFKFVDPTDATATDQVIAVGTNTAAAYQLVRAYGGFIEPVFAPGILNLYRDKGYGKGLLTSTARTNFLLQSQTLDNAIWTKTSCTVTANNVTAPDGTATGDTVIESAAFETPRLSESINVTTGTVYTFSIYAKEIGAGSQRYLTLVLSAGFGGTAQATFDVGAGTVTNVSSNVTAKIVAVANGWFRCSITTVPASTTGSCGVQPRINQTSGPTAAYTGDGVSGLSMWGAQFEARSEACEYVPTTTAQVTVTDYSVSTTGLVTLTANLGTGHILSWSGTFYWRCAFSAETMDFINDGLDIWKTNKITFETVKP